jgi:predicted DNA binding CopG/RHH family protein
MPKSEKPNKTVDKKGHWAECSNEAEEAAWWEQNQDYILRKFREDAQAGTLKRTATALVGVETLPAKPISIRLPQADIALARQQAAENGVPYQTWLKQIIHRGLRKTG